jgi:hypothetical protein
MTLKATVTLQMQSFLPKDVAVNTFHFNGTTTTHGAAAFDALVDFYKVDHEGDTMGSIADHLSSYLSNSNTLGARIRLVDFDPATGTETGTATEIPFNIGVNSSGTNLPLEVAVATSYSAGAYVGVPPARRRGRIYIGPLKADVVVGTVGQPPVVNNAFVLTCNEAAQALQETMFTAGAAWSVYSRVDGALRNINGGYTNNEFDTQRRREREADTRVLWEGSEA